MSDEKKPGQVIEMVTPEVQPLVQEPRPCTISSGITETVLINSLEEAVELLGPMALVTMGEAFEKGLAHRGIWAIPHPDVVEVRQQGAVDLLATMTKAARCFNCHEPATCVGEYETDDDNPGFGCDTCCGHGNEDGWCLRIVDDVEEESGEGERFGLHRPGS